MFKTMLAGAIMLNAWAISVFFIRFWRKTRDRLFAWFALAFILLGVERVLIIMSSGEAYFHVYLVRLVAFLLIIFAVWDKNRARIRVK
jgi:hypothetical protein